MEKITGVDMTMTKQITPELQFLMEANLSNALEILTRTHTEPPLSNYDVATVRKLVWEIEAAMIDGGLIHTDEQVDD